MTIYGITSPATTARQPCSWRPWIAASCCQTGRKGSVSRPSLKAPKGIRSAHKNATSATSETRTQLTGPYFVFRLAWQHLEIFNYRLPNKTQNNRDIFTNLLHVPDKKFREKQFNTAFQGHHILKQKLR